MRSFGQKSNVQESLPYPQRGFHLMVSQDAKRKPIPGYVALVFHGIGLNAEDALRPSADEFKHRSLSLLAELVHLEASVLEKALVKSKVIDWEVSQMVRPLDALMPDVIEEFGDSCCVCNGVVLAGDYFTSSNFVGCYGSAAAAVRAACRILLPEK